MRLVIQVKPCSKETKLLSDAGDTLMMYVAAPPAKGKANREIVKWMSKKLGKSSSNVRIVAGLYSNTKIVEILDVSENEVKQMLGISIKPSRD